MPTLRFRLRFIHTFAWLAVGLVALGISSARAEDGYRLWLRYDPISDSALRASYAAAITEIVVPSAPDRPAWAGATIDAARDELVTGLRGLLGSDIPVVNQPSRAGALMLANPRQPEIAALISESDLRVASEEGFVLRRVTLEGQPRIVIVANRDIGLLYGAFALLRHLQTHQPIEHLNIVSAPRIQRRLLNHWDNLNGFVERGYAGESLWDWFHIPEYMSPRYRDYARALSSIGINGTVLTNVNANALVLTPEYLKKVGALAEVFRPYGIRVYLTARFSAPMEIGGLKTADPLDAGVKKWWTEKVAEIYRHVPNFGGFLVKANSEGQPGPQNYNRNHADGANMLADALQVRGGIVMWRAFVYDNNVPDDRHKQGYSEFQPLDGQFRDNVIVQVKNGAIDFMPREPFHPLFGAMPKTPLALELQITQEYLGSGTQLVFLGPLFEEVLDADTYVQGPGSTVAKIVDGSLDLHGISVIAGVSNVGNDRNWTGHPFGQANWYAYGRLAWDPSLDSAKIADEWIRMTFSNDPAMVKPIAAMMLESREAAVNYSMPLGLHHIMAEGHHHGPGPWVDQAGRADWTSVYYHRADEKGIGFDRTKSGSDALGQYAPEIQKRWSDPATTPDELLLWFHHLPWDYKLRSGRTLWDEIALHYQRGVETVRTWRKTWDSFAGQIDEPRYSQVKALLARQEREAREWRDACLLYFQTFSKRPLPAGVEPPEHPLEYYKDINIRYAPGHPGAR
ncbi:MAG TPA: alpha-glucuronidase family glycosyl hydrolase [Opitutus sp.]|nr:alpha-glucuronidase family glycosyl hydrolase [Opitutus sp.]